MYKYSKLDPVHGKMTIEVEATTKTPLATLLTSLDSSCQCNFITWNKAYSMFPKCTFNRHKTYDTLRPAPQRDWEESWQLSEMGWEKGTMPTPHWHSGDSNQSDEFDMSFLCDHYRGGDCHNLVARDLQRYVCDKTSWIIKLDTTQVAPPSTPTWVTELSSFSVGVNRIGRFRGNTWSIIVDMFDKSLSLKYKYVPHLTFSSPCFRSYLG